MKALDFAGTWLTSFGPMTLERRGRTINGSYRYGAAEGSIKGRADGERFLFRYHDPAEEGEGEFRLVRPGRFLGTYRTPGGETRRWNGERGFDGIWETSFGRLRLFEEREGVRGCYSGPGFSSLQGDARDGRLEFRYEEPLARGEGHFTLSEDGLEISGEWRQEGGSPWEPWSGRRLAPQPGVSWLMVFEAHWQRSAAEPEYAFGNMLREVFARRQGVNVRQRYFHDAASLEHWCRELIFLPEPAILVIASHGSAHGLSVHGQVIPTTLVLETLRAAESLRLLHFSSCLVGADGASVLENQRFPVSGYTTSVDWGASALIEFTYLDLILNRGYEPAEAAAALPTLVPYALDTAPPGSPYPPAGFRFFAPRS